MQLSREAIEEFKAIYQEAYGIALSDAEAQDMGQRLLALFQILARPPPPHAHESDYHHGLPIDG